jgi:hypothetical protein
MRHDVPLESLRKPHHGIGGRNRGGAGHRGIGVGRMDFLVQSGGGR